MIDLKKRTYKNGRTILIDKGVPINGYTIRKEPVSIEEIEKLYHAYKFSIPSEIEDRRKRNYFKALPLVEIPAEALFMGINRTVAREKLELTILEGVLNGSITWEMLKGGKWFWQSKNDESFIILKEWIE